MHSGKMTDTIKQVFQKISEKENRIKLIIILAAAALLCLLLSDSSCTAEKPVSEKTASFDTDAYVSSLENRIENIVSSIYGAGKVRVLVTLQNSEEYIYATNSRNNLDTSESYDSSGRKNSDESSDNEESVMTIDGENGKEALIRTVISPTVEGVVIVCQGAEKEDVRARIIEAVTTALGISSRRVCVTILSE